MNVSENVDGTIAYASDTWRLKIHDIHRYVHGQVSLAKTSSHSAGFGLFQVMMVQHDQTNLPLLKYYESLFVVPATDWNPICFRFCWYETIKRNCHFLKCSIGCPWDWQAIPFIMLPWWWHSYRNNRRVLTRWTGHFFLKRLSGELRTLCWCRQVGDWIHNPPSELGAGLRSLLVYHVAELVEWCWCCEGI